jgi:tRNA (guanine26-N2/guanine27-N2)-dimethyltransferase
LILNTFAKYKQSKESNKEVQYEVLEALAATGLRSIRFIKEVPAITKIVINDFDPNAIEAAKKNLGYNNIDLSKVQVENKDANVLMQEAASSNKIFDVIDLDPYGTAIDFLDAAIRALKQDGKVKHKV